RGFSALIGDLAQRGLLDTTLLMVTSEMGRQPKIGDPRSGGPGGAGRGHWTHCMRVLLARGGGRGGPTFGARARRGGVPAPRAARPTSAPHPPAGRPPPPPPAPPPPMSPIRSTT